MPESKEGDRGSEEEGPSISDNVIRIQLRKPRNRKWELVTRNCSPGRVFPTIQLFDCDGNLLLETNDDNISINSTDVEKTPGKRHSKSLGASDFAKRQINFPVKKNNSVTGDRVYTRFYKRNSSREEKCLPAQESFDNPSNDACILNDDEVVNNLQIPVYGRSLSSPLGFYSSGLSAFENSELDNSSYKSSDNESCSPLPVYKYVSGKAGTLLLCDDETNNPNRRKRPIRRYSTNSQCRTGSQQSINLSQGINDSRISNVAQRKLFTYNGMPIPSTDVEDNKTFANKVDSMPNKIYKSASYRKPNSKRTPKAIRRANTDLNYSLKTKFFPDDDYLSVRNMSFLDIYLRSLPTRDKPIPQWLEEITNKVRMRKDAKNRVNETWRRGMVVSDESTLDPDFLYDDDVDSTVENEIRRRLRRYQRVTTCSDYWAWKKDTNRRELKRRYSEGAESSSSDSVDEADKVLMRLRRRIFQNKKRERRESKNGK